MNLSKSEINILLDGLNYSLLNELNHVVMHPEQKTYFLELKLLREKLIKELKE